MLETKVIDHGEWVHGFTCVSFLIVILNYHFFVLFPGVEPAKQGRCKQMHSGPCDGPWAGTSHKPGEEVKLGWPKARINLSRGE